MSGETEEVVFVAVPLPKVIEELAKARGVSAEELAKEVEERLLRELKAMEAEAELRRKEAQELSSRALREAWEKLEELGLHSCCRPLTRDHPEATARREPVWAP